MVFTFMRCNSYISVEIYYYYFGFPSLFRSWLFKRFPPLIPLPPDLSLVFQRLQPCFQHISPHKIPSFRDCVQSFALCHSLLSKTGSVVMIPIAVTFSKFNIWFSLFHWNIFKLLRWFLLMIFPSLLCVLMSRFKLSLAVKFQFCFV